MPTHDDNMSGYDPALHGTIKKPEQKGLPVAGYKATQPQAAIDAVNRLKVLEERVMREIDALKTLNSGGVSPTLADQRLLAIGHTQMQGAFMFLARAVFQPGRVALPEDSVTIIPLDGE